MILKLLREVSNKLKRFFLTLLLFELNIYTNFTQKIFDDSAFDIVRKRDRLPGKGHTHDQLKEIVRNHSETVYHPVGTCKMGPSSDDMAVVDNQLKVHGIEGLRIADASIMPTIVGGNTNAPSIAIGEKLANLLKSP